MTVKIIGNIQNIPDYKLWAQLYTGPESVEGASGNNRSARIAGRKRTADLLAEKYRYPRTDNVAEQLEDHFKWKITDFEVINRIASIIGFSKPLARVQLSYPGHGVPLHCDNLTYGYVNDTAVVEHGYSAVLSEEEKTAFFHNNNLASRVIIFLDDWKLGQGFVWENGVMDQWKCGDIITWDWQNDAHATFNVGFWERPILRLSGLVSEKFRDLQTRNEPFLQDYRSK